MNQWRRPRGGSGGVGNSGRCPTVDRLPSSPYNHQDQQQPVPQQRRCLLRSLSFLRPRTPHRPQPPRPNSSEPGASVVVESGAAVVRSRKKSGVHPSVPAMTKDRPSALWPFASLRKKLLKEKILNR
ncbi:hypothetical protein AAG570_002486 [Ranatra chinensis]|uniref:Uncharacterized protein n=1 Tax=Ranatra chinensis TaxID=642074 RepID=A0ABD0Y7P1_9HEMI